MSLIQIIAERLRLLRLRHHLTQQEAAELMDVSLRFYQVLESGQKKQIWLETVERAASVYGLDAGEFIGRCLPENTHVEKRVAESNIHNRRSRGPYLKGHPKA